MVTTTARSRHSVLVTQPLSPAARRRLEMFFDVQALWQERVPTREELADSLRDKAGVLTDNRLQFDADLIGRLPLLRAICHANPGPHAVDLPACTKAGIRATGLPPEGSTQLRDEASAQHIWEGLLPLLQRAAPSGDGPARYGRWRAGAMSAAPRATLSLVGNASWVPALLTRAADARVRVLQAAFDAADLVLLCDSSSGLSTSARVIDGAAMLAGAMDYDVPDPSRVAAEDLVAALGFGRHGWHPPNLLNTEILCDSCC